MFRARHLSKMGAEISYGFEVEFCSKLDLQASRGAVRQFSGGCVA
jgi:hypothetical protein